MMMKKLISCVLVGIVILHSGNGTLMDDLVDKLLKDPHTREIIEKAKSNIENEQSREMPSLSKLMGFRGGDQADIPPSISSGYRGGDAITRKRVGPPPSTLTGFRGGDALMKDRPNPKNRILPSIRAGDTETSNQESVLLDQLKKSLEAAISKQVATKDDSAIPWKKDINTKESAIQWKRFKEGIQNALPWKRSSKVTDSNISKRQNALPWKRELYKRLVSDINELFSMTDKEGDNAKRSNNNQDQLSDDLSSLLKNI